MERGLWNRDFTAEHFSESLGDCDFGAEDWIAALGSKKLGSERFGSRRLGS